MVRLRMISILVLLILEVIKISRAFKQGWQQGSSDVAFQNHLDARWRDDNVVWKKLVCFKTQSGTAGVWWCKRLINWAPRGWVTYTWVDESWMMIQRIDQLGPRRRKCLHRGWEESIPCDFCHSLYLFCSIQVILSISLSTSYHLPLWLLSSVLSLGWLAGKNPAVSSLADLSLQRLESSCGLTTVIIGPLPPGLLIFSYEPIKGSVALKRLCGCQYSYRVLSPPMPFLLYSGHP